MKDRVKEDEFEGRREDGPVAASPAERYGRRLTVLLVVMKLFGVVVMFMAASTREQVLQSSMAIGRRGRVVVKVLQVLSEIGITAVRFLFDTHDGAFVQLGRPLVYCRIEQALSAVLFPR